MEQVAARAAWTARVFPLFFLYDLNTVVCLRVDLFIYVLTCSNTGQSHCSWARYLTACYP